MKWLLFIYCTLSAIPVLAGLTTFECSYPVYSDIEGTHKTQQSFDLTFILDMEAKKAYLHGNMGSSEVKFLLGNGKISFLEITDTGNIITTTRDNGLNSVHSRNIVIEGSLIASQYYGSCHIK